jgi:hypothetical protein
MRGMTHIESKTIRALLNQPAQDFGSRARRAERANDLRLAHRQTIEVGMLKAKALLISAHRVD